MDRISFTINGTKYSAGPEVSADTTLNEFIRRHADLRGTKYMCLQGSCGACIVTVRAAQGGNGDSDTFSANSCLVAVMSCDGWDITTIEGIGSRQSGYNIIQKRLNNMFGSQCGYCSPGFVMSMYSLVQSKKSHMTEEEIEKSFGSNLCRCTGYRPILEAFKSFAIDPHPDLLKKVNDIEDLGDQVCPKSGKGCTRTCLDETNQDEWCLIDTKSTGAYTTALPRKTVLADDKVWYAVGNIKSLLKILDETGNDYMLVAGNTAKGAYPLRSYPRSIIDISNIVELRTHYIDVNLVLGANITISETIHLFRELSKSNDFFWYLDILADHMENVAHIPVRNIGTLAGNLVLKHKHPDFQSDIFLLFECVGATVTLVTPSTQKIYGMTATLAHNFTEDTHNIDIGGIRIALEQLKNSKAPSDDVDRKQQQKETCLVGFMNTSIEGRVMTQIKLPPLSKRHKLVTYKVTPRSQNAHAQVNAAFLFEFNSDINQIQEARIVYGGISPDFSHAYKTEQYLRGCNVFSNKVLQVALKKLLSEISPQINPPEPSVYYRKKVAVALFYKCILKLCPPNIIKSIYQSGSTISDRPPISRSYQEYDTNQKEYPITQPLLKKEGLIQCAGEAKYSDDLPTMKDEVFAAFVLSTVTTGKIESVDGSSALKINGVLAVLTSADIPGKNSITRAGFTLFPENEELLASDKVKYYNQPVAIVVATTQSIAEQATDVVIVNYKDVSKKPPVFTINDAILAPEEENRLIPSPGIEPTNRGVDTKKIIKGKFYNPQQFHHQLELHTCVTIPVDNNLEVYSSTQFMDMTQASIAQVVEIPENQVIVRSSRCGGGFGCKISRGNFAACATALVAKHLNKACRMYITLTRNMHAIGKRPDTLLDYEIGVNVEGKIQYMDAKLYINAGSSTNESENTTVVPALKNCYDPSTWKVQNFGVVTDAPANCAMRGPGTHQGISAIEHIMDHIATEIQKDHIQVRKVNYRLTDNQLPTLMPKFLEQIDYVQREEKVIKFNKENRWKKRGIKLTNMAYPVAYLGNYPALVAVYHGDGSVIINAGGIEIGQGIFTRLAQVAAKEFGIPVEKVNVLPSFNFATPNAYTTASSITTECVAYSVIKACEQINSKLAPVRASKPNATWEEIVFEADSQGILLQANYLSSPHDPKMINYSVFGIAVIEVELDILTGKNWIVRADIYEDVGKSINPALDVGQVEGAFIQSLSLWTMEEIIYDEKIGKILTDRTWNYNIFGAQDIPSDFRVYLSRNATNPTGVLGSKAVGEPAVSLAHVVVDALRDAVKSTRKDSGYDISGFEDLNVPVTNENAVRAADVKIEEFLLY